MDPITSKLYAYKVNTKHTQQVYKTWYTLPLTFQTYASPFILPSYHHIIDVFLIIKMPISLSTGKTLPPKVLAVSPTMEEGRDHDPVNREELFAGKCDPPSRGQ